MRIATYNVEWFNNLFGNDGHLLEDREWSGRYQVTRAEQLAALGIVFTAMDADAVMVIEAPDQNRRRSTVRALENFAATYGLRARKAVIGFASPTEQEIALLYDPDILSARHDPLGDATGKKGATDGARFDSVFRMDVDIDTAPELITWSKPPLELAVKTAGGFAFRLIGVHAKSKAPHGARSPDEIMRLSIENRRKQLAQCIWLRQRVETHLARGEPLMVMGDFNDGPGLDEYEKLFGHSGVEIVMGIGENGVRRLHDPHAMMALGRRAGAVPSSARFYLADQKRYFQALLDYLMLSPEMCEKSPRWRIWHPFDDPVCWKTPELREALLTASDHFPVSVDLDIAAA